MGNNSIPEVVDFLLDGNSTVTENLLHEFNPLIMTKDVIAILVVYGTSFFMGCEVKWDQIKKSFSFRKQLLVGIAGQYLLMPPCGFLASKIFGIQGLTAVGVSIMTCSPGGGYSNLLTYLYEGEVWFSAVLTIISSVLAFGVMPLNLWLYGELNHVSIPYLQMVMALVLVNVFLSLGVLTKWKAPKVAQFLTNFGAATMALLNIVWVIIWICLNPTFFADTSWNLYGAVFFIIAVGVTCPALVSQLFGFSVNMVKTLAIETAYQSIGTALSVTIISFQAQEAMKVQSFIFLYNIIANVCGTLLGGLYKITKRIIANKGRRESTERQEYTITADVADTEE